MSRSRKKNPIGPLCCVGKGACMRVAKRLANRRFRRYFNSLRDWAQGTAHKRFDERFAWPDDGKVRRPDEPKAWRK
jgi:hypothetical protein